MKKILFILGVALLCVSGFGQAKAVRGELNSPQIYDMLTRIIALENGKIDPVPDSAILLFHYEFTEDSIDQTGYRRDFTPSSAFLYDDLDTEGGSWWGDFTSSTRYADIPITNVTEDFVVMVDVANGTTNESKRTLIGNMTSDYGWELRIDPTIGRALLVVGTIGGIDSVYTDPGAFTVNTTYPYGRFRIAATSDGEIYINGVAQSVSGSISTGYQLNATLRMGQGVDGDNYAYCRLDNVKIYSGKMTATDILDEYKTNPYYEPEDNAAPIPLSAQVNRGTPGVMSWRFDKNLFTSSEDSLVDALEYTANDSIYTIDSVELVDPVIVLYTDPVPVGSRLRVSYNSGYFSGVKSKDSILVASYNNYIVTNNLIADSSSMASFQWMFENNNADSVNNWNGVDTAMVYSLDSDQGTYSGSFINATRKWWVPSGFNSDTLPENFTIHFKYKTSVSSTGMTIFANEPYGTVGEGVRIYANTSGFDMYMTAETGNSGNETSAVNDFVSNTWQTWDFTYTSSTGAGKIYLNGVDVTTDGTADANVDLSGPWRLGHLAFGLIDDFQLYDSVFTAADYLWLYENPGKTLLKGGNVDPPDPPDPTEFTSYADSIFAWDGEDSDLGSYTAADVQAEFINPTRIESTIANYTSIVDVPAQATGAASRAMRSFYPSGEYAASLISTQFFSEIPYDPRNKKIYLSYNVMFRTGFTIPGGIKNPGWIAGYNREVYLGTKSGARRNLEEPYHFEGAESATTFKGITGGGSVIRATPYLWWGENTFSSGVSSPNWYDPDDPTSLLMIDVSDSIWHNIAWCIDLGDEGQHNAYVEGFYNGKLAMKITGLKMRDVPIVVDILKVYLMFGGGEDVAATRDEWVIWDDFYVFRYRTDYAGYYEGESPAGRELLLPNGERQIDGTWLKY